VARKRRRSKDALGIAIVGCGQIARAHANAIGQLRGAELVACCDTNEEALRCFAEANSVPRRYRELAEVLGDDEVQAVALCLPHDVHCRAAVAAAEAGKHILCEKPMAISLAEADRMIAAADEAPVTLMIGQILRFRQSYRTARKLIQSGRIGRPRNVIRRRTGLSKEPPRSWADNAKVSGGWLLYGYGSHELDALLWLSDTEVETVYAQARTVNPLWHDFDELSVQMSLADGSMATLNHSLNANRSWWDELVIGTEGSLYVDSKQIILDEETIPITETPTWGMLDQYEEFVAAIRERRQPQASGADVRKTMVALEAVKRSLKTGQPVDATVL